jgi:hypothetical protein
MGCVPNHIQILNRKDEKCEKCEKGAGFSSERLFSPTSKAYLSLFFYAGFCPYYFFSTRRGFFPLLLLPTSKALFSLFFYIRAYALFFFNPEELSPLFVFPTSKALLNLFFIISFSTRRLSFVFFKK